jgi:hypothetical protein
MVKAECNKGMTNLSIIGQTDVILAELCVIVNTALKEMAKDYDNDYEMLLDQFINALSS